MLTRLRRLPTMGREAVVGKSMEPTLKDGDWIVTFEAPEYRVGDVVVAKSPQQPGLRIVKRVTRIDAEGYWLEGDNIKASDDSRAFGWVHLEWIEARVLARYWPRPKLVLSAMPDAR